MTKSALHELAYAKYESKSISLGEYVRVYRYIYKEGE